MLKIIFLTGIFYIPFFKICIGQIAYDRPLYDNFYLGSYGRIGVDWNYENDGSIGRRLNLNNMGSVGGRLEEQDYFELATGINFNPKLKSDSMDVSVNTRFSFYSRSLSLFGNSSSSSLGGLEFALPELFIEARGVGKKDNVNLWVGARLYRGPDIHIADNFYFNDHSGQGFGVETRNTRFAAIFVSSTDTTSTLPPYFYLNIKTGTPTIALRQRHVWIVEQDQKLNEYNKLTYLFEYHRMGKSDEADTIPSLSYPGGSGLVLGIRNRSEPAKWKAGSFNDISVRFGSGIANGGEGGVTRTYLTFGAPDTTSQGFKGAYSWAIVEHILLNFSHSFTLNAYAIYNQSRGAADTDDLAMTFFGQEVFNRKEEFAIGGRGIIYLTDHFHLMTELHYSQRKDGSQPWYKMTKLSLVPTFAITGERNAWARPQMRFIFSLARYNNYAKENLYSPYLQFVGQKDWGYFLGIKGEWWIWK